MLLWIIFAALMAVALAAVLSPFLRSTLRAAPALAHDTAIYKDQLAEIDADLARGLIGEADATAARTEISRRLLAAAERYPDAPAGKGDESGRTVTPIIAIMFAGLGLPALSVGLYLAYGSPNAPDQPLAARLQQQDAARDITALVGKVEARLRAHPEDGRGWDVIAPVYLKLRRYNDAARAYQQVLRLEGENAARLVGYGEALVLAENGIVSEDARKAFEKANKRDKTLIKPRFWLGMAKEQDGRFGEAAEIWRGMLAESSPDTPWRGMVEQRLKLAESKTGAQPAEGPDTQSKPAVEEKGPSQEDVAAAQQMTAGERAAMINQMVDGLAQRLKQDGSDLQGWLRLVRAYTVLGKREEASEALKSARANFKDDAKALFQLDTLAGSLGL